MHTQQNCHIQPAPMDAETAELKYLITHEIVDFCATLGAPGEPESPENMQHELTERIDNAFDFWLSIKAHRAEHARREQEKQASQQSE